MYALIVNSLGAGANRYVYGKFYTRAEAEAWARQHIVTDWEVVQYLDKD